MSNKSLNSEKMIVYFYQLAGYYGVDANKTHSFISQNSVKTRSGQMVMFAKPCVEMLSYLNTLRKHEKIDILTAKKEYMLLSVENPFLNEACYISDRLKGFSVLKSTLRARNAREVKPKTFLQKLAAVAVVASLSCAVWVPQLVRQNQLKHYDMPHNKNPHQKER